MKELNSLQIDQVHGAASEYPNSSFTPTLMTSYDKLFPNAGGKDRSGILMIFELTPRLIWDMAKQVFNVSANPFSISA